MRESKRRGSRVAGKFSLVAGKMSRVRNNPHFLNKLWRVLPTFFRIKPCYSSGNVDGNQEKLITASDQSSLLWVAVRRQYIQLEAFYKAFMDGTGKCGKGPSLLEKQDKATREQISRARQLEEDFVSMSSEKISATQIIYLL